MVTMKKYISFLFAALLLGTSCTDTRTDYMMGDTVHISLRVICRKKPFT